jgi:hypothetical protein
MRSLTVIDHGKLKLGHQYMEHAVLKRYHMKYILFIKYYLLIKTNVFFCSYSPEQLYNAQCNLADYLFKREFDSQIALELPWLQIQILQSLFCQTKQKRYNKQTQRKQRKILYYVNSQQQLANLLLNVKYFEIFCSDKILEGELVKYP